MLGGGFQIRGWHGNFGDMMLINHCFVHGCKFMLEVHVPDRVSGDRAGSCHPSPVSSHTLHTVD